METGPLQPEAPLSAVDSLFAALHDLVDRCRNAKPAVIATQVLEITRRPDFNEALVEVVQSDAWPRFRRDLISSSRAVWNRLKAYVEDAELQRQQPPDPSLPQIEATVRHAEVTEQAVKVLADACGEELFDRAGTIAQVYSDGDQHRIREVPKAWLNHLLSKHICWVAPRGKDRRVVPCEPPDYVGPSVMSMPDRSMFSRLKGVSTSPVFRRDGTLVTRNGFDAESGWMVRMPDDLEIRVPERPTDSDVGEAMALLHDIVKEFPFQADCHRSSALAYLLTIVCRTYYDGPAPMFFVSATKKGSGKDLLINTMTRIATGYQTMALTWPGEKDEAETEKRVHGAYLSGAAAASWENVPTGSAFKSPTFDRVLTQNVWTGRDLSRNSMTSVLNMIAWSMSVNNGGIGGDMVRRIYPCILAPQMERPERRQGLRPLEYLALERRSSLLSAALTVARAWILNGAQSCVPDIGSYRGWSCVRSMLVSAGDPDPIDGVDDLAALEDVESEEIEAIHNGFAAAFGLGKRVTNREILDRARLNAHDDDNNLWLRRVRQTVCEADSPGTALGMMFSKIHGAWHRGRCLHKTRIGTDRGWYLERRDREPEPELFAEPGESG